MEDAPEVPVLEVPVLELRCWGTATGCEAAGPGATAVGGPPPSSADRSICSPQASVSAAREAGRPCRIGCAQELQNSLMPLRGTPQDPSPAELSTFLIVCYKRWSPPGARSGWAPGWGCRADAGTLARRMDRGAGGPGVGHQGRAVRLSEFWTRMRAQFGDAYASSVAKDHVLSELGERTVDRALADGVEAKAVWRAVCKEFDVPPNLR